MLKITIFKVVDWMGALLRPSFYVLLLAALLAACTVEQPVDVSEPASTANTESPAVTIYRDKYGTPHVVADSNRGVYFGYGYAVATDRLFQMEMLLRTVKGRVAEVLGSEYLELDKHVRTGYDHRAVGRQLAELDEADREILEAYAEGFTQRVEQVLADKTNLLPKEFVEFDFLPQHWNSDDVAMIFIGSIIHRYSDFNSELDNLSLLNSLVQQHGPEKAQSIFDASKWLVDPSSPTTVPRTNESVTVTFPAKHDTEVPVTVTFSTKNDIKRTGDKKVTVTNEKVTVTDSRDQFTKRVVLDANGKFVGTTDNATVRALSEMQIAKHGYTSPEYSAASNFWSVSSKKLSDADGALVNGPQFAFGLPSYVYGIGLHGGDFNVVGNTLLGLPTLLFAHNNHVGWGSTAGMSDQVDVYREQLVKDSPEHYLHNNVAKPFESWSEIILVRDAEPVEVMARRTVHGMVVNMDAESGIAYSRARAWEGAEVQTLVAWVNLAKDTNMDAVQQRLSGIAANINFYYMDVAGNIGYTHGGRYPLRSETHDSRVPADGTGVDDWLSFRPYTDNPNVRNPQQGFIVNWNNRPGAGWRASDLWPQTWSKADRASHITAELNAKDKLSTDDVWAITEGVSYDDVSAAFLLPYLQGAMENSKPDSATSAAFKLVEDWDREWRPEPSGNYGAAELIIESWSTKLFERVLKDDIGEQKFGMYSSTNNPNHPMGASMSSSVGVKVILRNLDMLASGKKSYDFFNGTDPAHVLAQTFADSVTTLIGQHGNDMSEWSLAPAPMAWKPYNFRGVLQASKDAQVSLPAYMNRGSENNFFIARDGEFIAYDVIPPGQSGFVAADGKASVHAKDQMGLYSSYSYKSIPFSVEQVKQAALSTEVIYLSKASNMKQQKLVDGIQKALDAAQQKKDLGAFIYLNTEGALADAGNAQSALDAGGKLGALHGVPIVVKDNTHVAGMPNSAGTPALKDFVPTENNPVIQRLIDAGAIVLGKTNMHELAFGITSNNAAFGAVHNAHDPSRIAGGSSGGTAVAIAAGIVEMGLGTDTGGSTRVPPALNGVVGFRPTMGRYPAGGVTPVSSTRDTVGPIANNVSNAALLDCVIADCQDPLQAANLQGLRLGIPREYFYANLSADVAAAMQNALGQLAAAGVELVEVEMPGLEDANNGVSFPVALYEFMQELPVYLEENDTGVSLQQLADTIASPDVKGTVLSQMGDEAMPQAVYQQAIEVFIPQLKAIYQKTFADYNVAALLVPTTPLTATPIATSDETVELNGEQVPTFPTFIRNTDPTSNAGLPSLTIPGGTDSDGMPIGIMLDGPANSDRDLFSIGLALEQLLATD